jgi:hypothetical protein
MQMLDAARLGDVVETPEGYIEAFARTARTGIQVYKGSEVGKPDMGTVRILRDEAAVFDRETVRQFANLPITIGHPKGGVKAEDWKQKSKGHTTGDIMRDGDYMRVGLKVMDADAVADVKSGKAELSWGYDTDLVWEAGIYDGEAYDAKMTNLRPNHLAIVDTARAGAKSRIGDEGDLGLQGNDWGSSPINDESEEPPMATQTVVVDGITIPVNDQAAQVIARLQADLTARDAAITAKDSEIAALTADKTKLGDEKAKLEKAVADSEITPDRLNDMVKKRKGVMTKAKKMMGKDPDEEMADGDIMRAAVTAAVGDSAKSLSDAQIEGAFLAHKVADETFTGSDPLRFRASDGGDTQTISDDAIMDAAFPNMKVEA